jgi:hypothetical protein
MLALFLLALLVRLWLHAGFILGDDAEEFQLVRALVDEGVHFEGHLRYRFPMWLFNWLAQLGLGNHEATFFLPTWLASSLLPVVAALTLRAAGHALPAALFAGLFVALSPFEVMIGALRANDLFVELFLACAFWLFVRFECRPLAQGSAVACALWLAFSAKLWSVFLYPVAGLYYLRRWLRERDPRGLVAFAAASLVLYAAASAFWRSQTGLWLPFLSRTSATYPVATEELGEVLLAYPRALSIGSEHGTTLFGAVPYLFLAVLAASLAGRRMPALAARAPRIGLDRVDVWLLCSCLAFFGLLQLFPNAFTFDRYYSVPRIFRYLAPLSYGLSLFTAKRLVDLGPLVPVRFALRAAAALTVLGLLAAGTLDATAPGRSHRARVAALREALRASCPPVVVVEVWQARFFREVYLREACPETVVPAEPSVVGSRDFERWLRAQEPALPAGAALVTGLPQFVYYACFACGPRIGHFAAPLDPRWRLDLELPPVSFDPDREPVRIYRWSGEPLPGAIVAVPALPAQQLMEQGVARFDAQDYPGTRALMGALLSRFPESAFADQAAYFHAVAYWREYDSRRTIEEFEAFLQRHPRSGLVRAAHYHIGMARRLQGRFPEARAAFEATLRTSDPRDPEHDWAQRALDGLPSEAPFDAAGRAFTEWLYRWQAFANHLAGVEDGAS